MNLTLQLLIYYNIHKLRKFYKWNFIENFASNSMKSIDSNIFSIFVKQAYSMAKLIPFRAIRPIRDKAHLVVTRPVSTYSKSVLKAKLESNPYSFIRIIHPEFNIEEPITKPNSNERFRLVNNMYHQFIDDEILIQDQDEHIYLYKQTTPSHEFLGVICGASVEEYLNDSIKKHEATLTGRETIFTDYLDIVGFNAEPVLLTYPHQPTLEKIYQLISIDRPEYEFTTTDRIKHELWVIPKDIEKEIQVEFSKIESTYIADGHHRSASSSRLAARRFSEGHIDPLAKHNYFLAFLMDEKRLNILEFNRLVDTLNNFSPNEFLSEISKKFEITKLSIPTKPSSEHSITMNLENEWYELRCKQEIIDDSSSVSCLDAEILTQQILTPLLGISDLKTSELIHFIPGNLGIDAIIQPIQEGSSKVGFMLYPVTIEQIKKVADNQGIMPPKSTWVEPKMRSGLTIYKIEK